MMDIDGVISLFGVALDFWAGGVPAREGSMHSIDGIPHFLWTNAAAHLLEPRPRDYELVWASGWEETRQRTPAAPARAARGAAVPALRARRRQHAHAHWKLVRDRAPTQGARPMAWVDDSFNDACHRWEGAPLAAPARSPPTPRWG